MYSIKTRASRVGYLSPIRVLSERRIALRVSNPKDAPNRPRNEKEKDMHILHTNQRVNRPTQTHQRGKGRNPLSLLWSFFRTVDSTIHQQATIEPVTEERLETIYKVIEQRYLLLKARKKLHTLKTPRLKWSIASLRAIVTNKGNVTFYHLTADENRPYAVQGTVENYLINPRHRAEKLGHERPSNCRFQLHCSTAVSLRVSDNGTLRKDTL